MSDISCAHEAKSQQLLMYANGAKCKPSHLYMGPRLNITGIHEAKNQRLYIYTCPNLHVKSIFLFKISHVEQ